MTDTVSDTFRSALSDAPSPATDAPAIVPDVFADEGPVSFDDLPGAQTPAPPPVVDAKTSEPALKPDEQPPSWRLREMREERDRIASEKAQYERELAELREFKRQQEAAKQPAPDFFEKPDEFVGNQLQQRLTPFEQKLQEIQQQSDARFYTADFERAVDKYGEKDVRAALDAVKAVPGLADHLLKQPGSPHRAMMEWHRREQTLKQFGADPEAARQKIADELLSDPEHIARVMETARSGARPVIEAPQPARASDGKFLPSLNRTTAAQGGDDSSTPADTYRQSLAAPRGR